MFTVKERRNALFFELSSELRLVDRVIEECVPFLERYGITPGRDFNLVVREMLNNAVEHGSGNNKDAVVACTLEKVRDDLFKITVEDYGPGFNHRDPDFTMPEDPYQSRHRGLALINAYADKLEFNEQGNKVTAYMDIRPETSFAITEKDDRSIITPSGSMSASNAEEFRKTISTLPASGVGNFIFDFSRVPDIDSVSLSVLIGFAKNLSKNNPDAVPSIINVSQDISDLLHMTALDRIFTVEPQADG